MLEAFTGELFTVTAASDEGLFKFFDLPVQ